MLFLLVVLGGIVTPLATQLPILAQVHRDFYGKHPVKGL
jgi:hypothetical protein